MAGYLLLGASARLLWGPAFNNLIFAAIIAGTLPLVLLLLARTKSADIGNQKPGRADLAEALLQSTSPMVLAASLDGSFTYLNPSAERVLGIRASH